MQGMHVLVVDDDLGLLKLIATTLQTQGYRVSTARNGPEALALLKAEPPNLMVLDLMMPGMDGLEICRQVRLTNQLPILVLSGMGEETRKVQALDLGADDYLTKPFGAPELLARIRALLRRATGGAGESTGDRNTIRLGNLVFDPANRQITVGGREVRLTPTEFSILNEMVRYNGKVLTHDMILSRVWGPEYRGSSQYLHIYMGRLRSKLASLEGAEIVTEPGVGYWLRVGNG